VSDLLLSWDFARHEDREEIKVFICTTEPTKSASTGWKTGHPRRWEYEVQQWIRRLEPGGTNASPYRLRVGRDSLGLAAISYYEFLDGPRQVDLLVMAIAQRLRHAGLPYADEMFVDTLDAITTEALEYEREDIDTVFLKGRVNEKNRASREMCRRAGLSYLEPAGPGVEVWGANFLV
jgi:hypothetical protein